MMDLFSSDRLRDPFPSYALARRASPVLRDPATGAWMVFDYEGVRRALHDADSFSSAVSPPPSRTSQWFIFSDPPRHTKLRALVLRAFTPAAVSNLAGRIAELSRELLAEVRERGELDLVADYAAPLPLLVIIELLGGHPEQLPVYKRWSDAMVALAQTLAGGDAAAAAESEFGAATREMEAHLRGLLAERRDRPTGDLLSRLVQAEIDGDRLTEEEILGFFQLLLVAGNETTTNLLSNALLCLLDHPDERLRLRSNPVLLAPAIEEVLRYRSPVQASFRVTRREVALGAVSIPAGQLVLPMIGSANRDPAAFEDPERFDIGRHPNPHLAFGHGAHFCLGASLARLEARVAIPDLLACLPEFELAEQQPWEPRRAFHVHGPSRLRLRFDVGARTR